MVQMIPVDATHEDVFEPVVIVIANGNAVVIARAGQPGLFGDILVEYLGDVFLSVRMSAPLVKKTSR